MGILNTVLRLRIFFQGRFDFEIKENALGEGSAVYLRHKGQDAQPGNPDIPRRFLHRN